MSPFNKTPEDKIREYDLFQKTIYRPLAQSTKSSSNPITRNSSLLNVLRGPIAPAPIEAAESITTESAEVPTTTIETGDSSQNLWSGYRQTGLQHAALDPESTKMDMSVIPQPGSIGEQKAVLLELAKKGVGGHESRHDYAAFNPNTGKDGKRGSGAFGKYQFIAHWHKDKIKEVTGLNMEQFHKDPEAQEKYFEYHFNNVLYPKLQKLRNDGLGGNFSDIELIGGLHLAQDDLRTALENDTLTTKQLGKNNPTILNAMRSVSKFSNG